MSRHLIRKTWYEASTGILRLLSKDSNTGFSRHIKPGCNLPVCITTLIEFFRTNPQTLRGDYLGLGLISLNKLFFPQAQITKYHKGPEMDESALWGKIPQGKLTVPLWYTTRVFPLWETQRAISITPFLGGTRIRGGLKCLNTIHTTLRLEELFERAVEWWR